MQMPKKNKNAKVSLEQYKKSEIKLNENETVLYMHWRKQIGLNSMFNDLHRDILRILIIKFWRLHGISVGSLHTILAHSGDKIKRGLTFLRNEGFVYILDDNLYFVNPSML